MKGLSSLRVRLIGATAVAAATINYSPGQTIRVPYHADKGSEADTIKSAREVAASAAVAGQKNPITRKDTCWLFPLVGSTCAGATQADRNDNINKFYDTAGQFSFFNQIKSIYNGASSSATVSADIASLNFPNAMQVTLGSNVQAGSVAAATTSTGTVPTLSAAGAGQATQNILYGGTFVASAIYPVISIRASNISNTAGNFGAVLFLSAREGVDIQNFKAGTSVNVNSPPSHTDAGLQGYIQYNSINTKGGNGSDAKDFKGALFFGGSYGYDHMSHGYARDYGFGDNVSNGIGQISFGVLVNGVARITVSKAFGPSQTYIDSTSNAQKTINNFKTWSFGITYQSPSKQ
jgi:hypothetical protein